MGPTKHRAVNLLRLALLILFTGALRAAGFDPAEWAVEQMKGGTVEFAPDSLTIRDVAGCTVWYRPKLSAPVAISFTATMLGGERPSDRVSDLNCFWMANDSRGAGPPYLAPFARSGKFADYDSLLTYYVGYAANNNSTTRFRRYDGTAARPLLPEHDLGGPAYLMQRGVPVKIRIVAREGVAEYWRNGERIFSYKDPTPLTSGWFAFRTVRSHLRIEAFQVDSLAK